MTLLYATAGRRALCLMSLHNECHLENLCMVELLLTIKFVIESEFLHFWSFFLTAIFVLAVLKQWKLVWSECHWPESIVFNVKSNCNECYLENLCMVELLLTIEFVIESEFLHFWSFFDSNFCSKTMEIGTVSECHCPESIVSSHIVMNVI